MNLGFVILYTNDMDKAKKFYTEALGLSAEPSSAPTFIRLRSGGGSMMALQDANTTDLPPAQGTHDQSIEISFEVEDVDATYRQWKSAGVEVVTEPKDLPFGRYFMAKDPEGHYLSAYRFKGQ